MGKNIRELPMDKNSNKTTKEREDVAYNTYSPRSLIISFNTSSLTVENSDLS